MNKALLLDSLERIAEALELDDRDLAMSELARLGEKARSGGLDHQKPKPSPSERRRRKLKQRAEARYAPRLNELARAAGYENYESYLKSDHWKGINARFRAAWKGRGCIACPERLEVLHHVSYERLGREDVNDVLPLCNACHGRLHQAHQTYSIPLDQCRDGLVYTLGIGRLAAEDRLRPWLNLKW